MTEAGTPGRPWDPGVQNERTRLAWQRTILAGLTCSLLVARLLADVSLVLAVTVGLAAMLNSAALGRFSSRRYVANQAALHRQATRSGGRAHLLLSALVLLTALGACVYLAVVP